MIIYVIFVRFWGMLSFRRPRGRAEEGLIEGSAVYHQENLCSARLCDEPLVVAAFSVWMELIDCGHVCVQPGDGGASL